MSYQLDDHLTLSLPQEASHSVIPELLSHYTYGKPWNLRFHSEGNSITMGKSRIADCGGKDNALRITDDGVSIQGKDYPSLIHGLMNFLNRVRYAPEQDSFYAENCDICESPQIPFRCAHLCVFPETTLDFLRKCVRSCAMVKYSHIILEFWGMLKFDCMKELSWPSAYSKEEIKALVGEANALGVEIIPMFNHLGHASACREIHGKHVVLDQNPRYEYLFDSYGWVWNFHRDDVKELHRKIRHELEEVCGNGSYFHLGCDEAYLFGNDENKAEAMAEYINTVSKELEQEGRRAIIWHDMMLSQEAFAGYVANSTKAVSELLLSRFDKRILVADWQYYNYPDAVWKTSQALKDSGFEVICCPWSNPKNNREAVGTVAAHQLYGVIHTTWHTLFASFSELIYAGDLYYNPDSAVFDRSYAAFVARHALPSGGNYTASGFSEQSTDPGL